MKLTHEFTVQYSFAICGMSPSEIHFQPLVPFPEIPDRGLSAILAREPARKRRHLLKYVAIFTLSFRFSYMFLVFFKVTKNLQKYKFPACSKPKAPGRTWLGAMWRTWQAAPVPVPAFPGLLLFCQMAEGIENQCHISTVTPQTVGQPSSSMSSSSTISMSVSVFVVVWSPCNFKWLLLTHGICRGRSP